MQLYCAASLSGAPAAQRMEKSASSLWDRWLHWQRAICWRRTTGRHNVPHVMQEFNIDSGYRLAGRSWRYYLHSGFRMHNETVNWLSHSLGAFVIVATLLRCTAEAPDAHPQDAGILWLFGATSVLLHAASAVAHLLHSRSELAHCTVFFVDNAAVGLSAFGCNLANIAFLSSSELYDSVAWATAPLLVAGAVGLSAAFSLALARSRRRYSLGTMLLMFGPSSAFVAFGFLPFAQKLFDVGVHAADHDLRPFLHLFVFLVGFAFYASCFPERCARGHFDLVGHSHQWFHLLVTASHYLLINFIADEIRSDSPGLFSKRRSSHLSLETATCSLAVAAACDLVVVVVYLRIFRYDTKFKSKEE